MHCVWHRIFSWCKWWVWGWGLPIWAGPESCCIRVACPCACVCVRVHIHTHTHTASGVDDFWGRIKQKGCQSNSGPASIEKAPPYCWWHPASCTICCGGHLLKHSFSARQAEPKRATLRNSPQRHPVSVTPRGKEMFPLSRISLLVISCKFSAGHWAVHAAFFPLEYDLPEGSVTSLWNLGSPSSHLSFSHPWLPPSVPSEHIGEPSAS